MTLRRLLLVAVLSALTAGAIPTGGAAAPTKRRCNLSKAFPNPTLAVRGMECSEGLKTARKVQPNGMPGRYRVTGWTGSPLKTLRHFDCIVRYEAGTGANRGGITYRDAIKPTDDAEPSRATSAYSVASAHLLSRNSIAPMCA